MYVKENDQLNKCFQITKNKDEEELGDEHELKKEADDGKEYDAGEGGDKRL